MLIRIRNLKAVNAFHSCTGDTCMKMGSGVQLTDGKANSLTSKSSRTNKSSVTVAETWSLNISSVFLSVPSEVNTRPEKSTGAGNTHSLQGWYFCRLGFFTEFVRSNKTQHRSVRREHTRSHRPQTCTPPLLRWTTARVAVNKFNPPAPHPDKVLVAKVPVISGGGEPDLYTSCPLPSLDVSKEHLVPVASWACAVEVATKEDNVWILRCVHCELHLWICTSEIAVHGAAW